MRIFLNRTLILFLASHVLLVSCGFTISHVYCDLGESWFIGSETPPCKYKSQEVNSSYQKDDGCCNQDDLKKGKHRQHDKFHFFAQFEFNEFKRQKVKYPVKLVFLSPFSTYFNSDLTFVFGSLKDGDVVSYSPPPDLCEPTLPELQVFII